MNYIKGNVLLSERTIKPFVREGKLALCPRGQGIRVMVFTLIHDKIPLYLSYMHIYSYKINQPRCAEIKTSSGKTLMREDRAQQR